MSEIIQKLSWNKKIEVLRVIKGWSQRQAADNCNTNQKNWWRWECKGAYPTKNSRLAICRAFGVSEEEIFNKE